MPNSKGIKKDLAGGRNLKFSIRSRILNILKRFGPMSAVQIKKIIGGSPDTARKYANMLVNDGLLTQKKTPGAPTIYTLVKK